MAIGNIDRGKEMDQRFNPTKTKYIKYVNPILKALFRVRKKQKFSLDDVDRILILDDSLIGDEVMNLVLYQCIRRNLPNVKVTLVARPWLKDQLFEMDLIDKFIEFDSRYVLETPMKWITNRKHIRYILKKINQCKYDLAIEPRGDLRFIFFMRFIKSLHKASYTYMDVDYLLTDAISPSKEGLHEIDAKLYLLQQLGFEISKEDAIPRLVISSKQKILNNRFHKEKQLNGKILFGVHPGASLDIKKYPYFPDVAEKVCRFFDSDEIVFLVFCGVNEEDIAEGVIDAVKHVGYKAILCKTGLNEYIGRVSLCDYMLCNDSGAGHLAAAYGIPVTAIFGPVNEKLYRPRGKNKTYTVSHTLDCKPCSQRDCHKKTRECIRNITVDEVIETVGRMIARSEGQK